MRAENKPCKRFWLRLLATIVAVLFVLTNVASDAVNRRRFISFELTAINKPCTVTYDSRTREKAPLRLLVSFVFFESVGMSACEVSNKRNNLATFLLSAVADSPPGVHFVFTFPELKPKPSSVLDSAGLLPGSDSGKAISKVLSGDTQNVELLHAIIKHPAADLCHHYAVILSRRRRGDEFDYVLVLNDGVRGPFFNADLLAETERRLPFENTPLWLVSLLTLMLTENSTRSVGPVLSCEYDVHIQSWTQLFDWRVVDTVLPILGATCEPDVDWEIAIKQEVAIGATLLSKGFSLAGLHPSCRVFSLGDKVRLRHEDPDILSELSWCKNILRADVSNFLDQLTTPDSYGFVKFGGTLWRDGLLPQRFVDKVQIETVKRFGILDRPFCYQQKKGRSI